MTSDQDDKRMFVWRPDGTLLVRPDAFIENAMAHTRWDAAYSPDSEEAADWAAESGWTAAEWQQSGVDGVRARWRAQWAAQQAAKQQGGATA